MADAIKVVVRCRPLNSREIARGASHLIRMDGNQTVLSPPQSTDKAAVGRATDKEQKAFTFDRSFWSAGDKADSDYASQQTVYDYLGVDLLNHAFAGFNTCLFAYGQTGSGKSYSMMGYGNEKGVIPLTCEALFERITALTDDTLSFTVEVSFLEIYNERCRDLLNPKNKGNLKVREHPLLGPYVEDLSKLAVSNYADVESLMDEGNKARTVAATQMNETSSRSHSIFTLLLTQRRKDDLTKMQGEKVSRISLVDLAGSERANSTGATGKVISALAQASSTPSAKTKKAKEEFVPYRDSVLTWLLKDSLGGNSKTAMIAAISPADYEETLSTLRDAAKQIKNKAVVNEDQNTKVIRELKEELLLLRSRLSGASSEAVYDASVPPEQQIVQYQTKSGEIRTVTKAALQEQLDQSEKLMAEVNQTWQEKLEQTQSIQKQREEALEALGISIEKNIVGVHTPKTRPHLVNLNEDPLMSECLIYQINNGRTLVGNAETSKTAEIRLSGENILDEHCYFECDAEGLVTLCALEAGVTMVNGQRLDPTKPGRRLKSGHRIIIGDWHVFRYQSPAEVQKTREKMRSHVNSPEMTSPRPEGTDSPALRPSSPTESSASAVEAAEEVDWSFARREAVVARLNGFDVNIDQLADSDLNALYRDISKVRSLRQQTSIGRPESRSSYLESADGESSESRSMRPFSGDTWLTDDTSLDSSLSNDEGLQEMRREMIVQLDTQRKEYEETLAVAQSGLSLDDITRQRVDMETKLKDLQADMQAQMTVQKREYEAKLKRARRSGKSGLSEIHTLREDEVRLSRVAVEKWRKLAQVKMAEQALSMAKNLKEANVISKELGKMVQYQFMILDDNLENPLPSCASDLLGQIDEDNDPSLQIISRPCLAIKILDFRHKVLTAWSMPKFERQLNEMRAIYKFIDKPSHSQHLNWDEPFYGSSINDSATLSFIGRATISTRALMCAVSTEERMTVWCPFTGSAIGSCRIHLSPKAIEKPEESANTNLGRRLTERRLPDGSKLTFVAVVDNLEGFSPELFNSVAFQMRAPAFIQEGDVFKSGIVSLDNNNEPTASLLKEYALDLNPEIRQKASNGLIHVEFHASIRSEFLNHVLDCDTVKAPNERRRNLSNASLGRRPEVELIQEEHHDVVLDVVISELDSNGRYSPVPVLANGSSVDPGAFFLRQGLQRRIELTLRHSSGRSWKWTDVSRVTLDNVRLLDTKGSIHNSQFDRPLTLVAAKRSLADFDSSGSCTVTFVAPWDSSAHNAICLNQNTPQGQRVLLHLACTVNSSESSPAVFEVDVAATIQGRDSKNPSRFLNIFGGQKTSSASTSLFGVRLQPTYKTSAADIWRRDTANVYVRGEEALERWRPNGVAMIEAFYKQRTAERLALDVQATKHIVASLSAETFLCPTFGENDNSKLRRALQLWQRQFGSRNEVTLGKEPISAAAANNALSSTGRKMKAIVQIVPRSGSYIRQSHLNVLRDPAEGKWHKQWFSLRRPYLYLSESSSAANFTSVINTSQIRVETSQEMEAMTGRANVFALYTAQNCYFLQAETPSTRDLWMNAIDPGYMA